MKEGNFTHTLQENILTSQPARTSRLKRILYSVIAVVAIIALFIGLKIFNRIQLQSSLRPKVIAAVRADFPTFCTDGEILADPALLYSRNALFADYDSQWGIRCDSWMKSIIGYTGDVTIMDIDDCTTIRPISSTLSAYYNEYETINKSNGKKLAVCP